MYRCPNCGESFAYMTTTTKDPNVPLDYDSMCHIGSRTNEGRVVLVFHV